jgi:hypothetical protein
LSECRVIWDRRRSCSSFLIFTNGIIDFGDAAHIIKVIDQSANACGNPQEGETMKEDFKRGATLATFSLEGVASMEVDSEIERAIREGRALVAIGFAATIVQQPIAATRPHHRVPSPAIPLPSSQQTRSPPGGTTSGTTTTPQEHPSKTTEGGKGDDVEFVIWPDAVFDDDDEEDRLALHFAVKYSDTETLTEELESMSPIGGCGDKTDSQGRTALDLAALTGQMELMPMLEKAGVKHKKSNKPKMRVTAKKRSPNVEAYKRYILDSL